MGEHSRTHHSPTLDFHSIFRKKPSFKNLGKVYKSLVKGKHHDKSFRKDKTTEEPVTPRSFELSDGDRRVDDNLFSRPALLLKTESKRSKTPTPSRSFLSRNESRRCKTPTPVSRRSSSEKETCRSRSVSRRSNSEIETPLSRNMSRKSFSEPQTPDPAASPGSPSESEVPPASLSRNMSRGSTTPIIFSQSTVRRKSPPVEKKLGCTLEDLCFGCVKKIKVTRDVIKQPGIIVQEEEILKIEVKPGWRKGTKITFEGKGNEKLGYLPADIVFSIDEKDHPLFSRDGDSLEIDVEIPLVNALTGCSIPVPLLGGETMTLSFENIVIYPGYEKVIKGQGMPDPKNDKRRGDLHIGFLINFPTELSDEQRLEAVRILKDCS